MIGENGNLVSLEEWKNTKKDNCFSDYLKVLNFSDLVTESNALINEIKDQDSGNDLISKTKLMMNEFATRLEKESKHLADTVFDMKKNIDNKKDN
jgi:hypothetical protein